MTPDLDPPFRAGLANCLTGLAVILFAISLELSGLAASFQAIPLLASFIGLSLTMVGGVQLTTWRS